MTGTDSESCPNADLGSSDVKTSCPVYLLRIQ